MNRIPPLRRLLLAALASSLPLFALARQEPEEETRSESQVELEARLTAIDPLLAELESSIAANREERTGLRSAHTRARRLDAENAALMRRHELLAAERALLRAELAGRLPAGITQEVAPVHSAASREERMRALLLGGDALEEQGLAEPAGVLFEPRCCIGSSRTHPLGPGRA